MIIKLHELNNLKKKEFNFYLFYGSNLGLIEETIDRHFKNLFAKNRINYDETELLKNLNEFKEEIFNKSFFDNNKLIIINRVSNKILPLIEELIEKKIEDTKIIIKADVLEKKSKLRNFFETSKEALATAFYEDAHESLLLEFQKIFREKKIDVSNEIINLIIERSKGNRINIKNEIEKILSYSKMKHKIKLEDALKLINLSENYDISELVDQNLSKNKKKSIKILNENSLNREENILILRTFLIKLKRLKILKINLEKKKNIEQVLSLYKPAIFWKDKIIVKKQLSVLSLSEIKSLIHKVNYLELEIKKNNQISDQIINNFILENLISANNVI